MSIDTPNLGEGSLERLGIELETQVPSEVLTPNMVRAMRLRRQRPIGYSYEDVDAAREQFADTSTWFIKALHERDLDVHRLGAEVDTLQMQVQSLQIELANEAYNAPVREALQQSQTDPEVELLGQRVQELTRKLSEAESALADAQRQLRLASTRVTELEANGSFELGEETEPQQFVQPAQAPELTDEERAEYESTLAERDDEIKQLKAALALEQSRTTALNEYREKTDEYITQLETELEQYENAAGVEQAGPVPPVAVPMPGENFTESSAAYAETDEDEEGYSGDEELAAEETYMQEAARQDEQFLVAEQDDSQQLAPEQLQAIGEYPRQQVPVEQALASDDWNAESVEPIGYRSEFDTDADEEPRDTDPEQPSDHEFFQEGGSFTAPMDSPEDTAVAQQTVAWNPDLVDDEDEENMPLPARKTAERADGLVNPYNGKSMPVTITRADLED